jgi:cystathionine gamma-synthase/methionine-gamma-lyase
VSDSNVASRVGSLGFASRSVHAGEHAPQPAFSPTTTPIYLSNSFSYGDTETLDDAFGNDRDNFVYGRHGNPTVRALEHAIASLEEAEDAVAVGSGMAALHLAILNEVQAGSRIVASSDLYGSTTALLNNLFATLGVKSTFADTTDLEGLRSVVAEVKPRVVLVETISNPLLRVADLAGIAAIAREHRARLVVDNTFASPYLVNPLKLGAHTVVHSTTKYLAGHGDVTGGAIASDELRIGEIRELTKLSGSIQGPFEAWLILRGIKTLPLRMREQSRNACEIARWLANHPRVERVHYPGFADLGPAERQFNHDGRGGMVSFDIRDAGRAEVFAFLESLRLVRSAATLGDVYTLALYPAISSHRSLTPEQRAAAGIGDGLIRLSVGIENVEDVIADLDQALAVIPA